MTRFTSLDTSQPTPGPGLLSAEQAREKLHEIVEDFFFQRRSDRQRLG
jgi:hypothetical protein